MSRFGGVPRQSIMSDIVITGATGVIGRRAVRELLAVGHRVAGVTRSARGRRLLEGLGAPPRRGRRLRPPTRAEIDAALAAVVGRDTLRPAVQEVPLGLEPVARSQRVSSLRLREATGWAPQVRGGIDGWRLIMERSLAA
jgi:nucleoside-diphosphate-sugar epimerase